MSIMLIVTIGTRDLLINGNQMPWPRVDGQKLREEFSKSRDVQNRLSYPIIRAVLEHVFNIEKVEKIDRLVLVATNQPESTSEKYRSKDTIEFARILCDLIPMHYKGKIQEVCIFEIPSDPSRMDEMYEFFEHQIQHSKKFRLENLEKCYVETSGGVPGANMALLLQAIRHYKEKCHPLYVSEKTGSVFPLKIGAQLLEEYQKEIIMGFLENYDYASISKILEQQKSSLYFLAEYARMRLYFDFESAKQLAQQGLASADFGARKYFEEAVSEINTLCEGDSFVFLVELYWNLWVKYHCKEYVDFLGRLYRFQDAILRMAVTQWLGLDTTTYDSATESYKVFEESLSRPEHQALYEYLKTQTRPNKKPFDLSWVDIPLLSACIQFLMEKGHEKVKSFWERYEKIKPLIRIRHHTILAHGFKGVCEDTLAKEYSGDLLSEIRELVELVTDKAIGENPFQKINNWFKALL